MNLSLLEVISTRGEIRIEEFKQLTIELCLKTKDEETDVSSYHMQMLYYLDALGHCECDFDSRKVYACKPAIVMLPGIGSIRAVLTGARSNELINRTKKLNELFVNDLSVNIIKQETRKLILPDTIMFEAFDEDVIRKFSDYIGVPFIGGTPISWIIANASGSLEEYTARLELTYNSNLNWKMRVFNPEYLCFQKGFVPFDLPYLIEFTNPISQQKLYLLVMDKRVANVDRDWGRYYILNKHNINILFYDQRKQVLAVPVYTPLPRLLTRAATLCSGIAAKVCMISHNLDKLPRKLLVNLYLGVNQIMADLIASKVGQRLNIFTLEYNDKEAFYD